jgi:hypothetical protein
VFAELPVGLLREFLAKFERRSDALKPLYVDRETEKWIYKATNQAMQPLLRRIGYRSLKQFEAAYAELGNKMPLPRTRATSRQTEGK